MKKLFWIGGVLLGLLFSISIASAATILFPSGGGTGTNTGPTAGQVLVGTSGGIYTPTSGFSVFPFTPTTFGSTAANSTSTLIGFTQGLYALGSSTIGDGTATGGVTTSGNSTTTGVANFLGGNATAGVNTGASATIVVNSSGNGNALELWNSNSGSTNLGPSLSFRSSSATGGASSYIQGLRTNSPSNGDMALVFANTKSASISESLRIDTAGNVGVATSSPFARLSVAGSSLSPTTPLLAFSTSTATGTSTPFMVDTSGDLLLSNGAGLQFGQSGMSTTSGGALTLSRAYSTWPAALSATSTGIALYNTDDQSTNFERLQMGWNGNIFKIATIPGGSGSTRALTISSVGSTGSGSTMTFNGTNGSATGLGQIDASRSTAGVAFTIFSVSGTNTGSSGTLTYQNVIPTLNQSGSAGYTALRVNATETTLGNGTKTLVQVGTSTAPNLFNLINTGATGIGSSSPYAQLSIHANPTYGPNLTTLFAIGSSTATATTTLFSVDNIGSTTLSSLFGACNTTSALTTDISGHITCGAISSGSGTVTNIATTYPIQGGPITTTGTLSLAFGTTTANLWSALQTFNGNASTTQITSTGNAYLATAGGSVGIASTSPSFPLSVNNAGSDAYITSNGQIVGRDSTKGFYGRVGPTHRVVLPFATSTPTWTGTSTPGIDAAVTMPLPFNGSIKDVRCKVNTFLGVNIQISGTNITPSYFVASSTMGTTTVTSSNTFTNADYLNINVGTTTSATASSGVVNGSCSLDIVETP